MNSRGHEKPLLRVLVTHRCSMLYVSQREIESVLTFKKLDGGWARSRTEVHGFADGPGASRVSLKHAETP